MKYTINEEAMKKKIQKIPFAYCGIKLIIEWDEKIKKKDDININKYIFQDSIVLLYISVFLLILNFFIKFWVILFLY